MPGKVNPVIPRGRPPWSCAQVIGNDAAVAFSGAPGAFELNVMLPGDRPATCWSRSGCSPTSAGCWPTAASTGIVANVERCRSARRVLPVDRHAAEPATSATRTPPAVAKQALKDDKTIREVVHRVAGYVDDGKLTEEQLDAALDVLSMTHP